MSKFAATSLRWFYNAPEPNKYWITERVRNSFWHAGVHGLLLDAATTESPFVMCGTYLGQPVEMSWEVGKQLTLKLTEDSDQLVRRVTKVMGFGPALRYTDTDNMVVYEWHRDGGQARWDDITGNPSYQRPGRLN